MSDFVVLVILLPSIGLIAAVLASDHNLRKKNKSQCASLIEYGWRIKSLEYNVWKLRDLVASGGQQDEDISNAYMSKWKTEALVRGGTSLGGIICPYCHMRTTGGNLTCSHCGAQVVDISTITIWGGK